MTGQTTAQPAPDRHAALARRAARPSAARAARPRACWCTAPAGQGSSSSRLPWPAHGCARRLQQSERKAWPAATARAATWRRPIRCTPTCCVLLPDALHLALGWRQKTDEADSAEGKKKPSEWISIRQVRAAIEFSTLTRGRGRLKVVIIHPAERMPQAAASALLKLLEEPQGGQRLLLACGDAAALMPTVRSRCHAIALPTPDPQQATRWLMDAGVADATVLARGERRAASGGIAAPGAGARRCALGALAGAGGGRRGRAAREVARCAVSRVAAEAVPRRDARGLRRGAALSTRPPACAALRICAS